MPTKSLPERVLETFLDPVLAGYIQDFDGGFRTLRPTQSREDHKEVVTLLCELSRDILFRLGPVSDVPDPKAKEVVAEIAALFRTAVLAINHEGDLLVQDFQAHIDRRADILLREKQEYAASGNDWR